MAPSPTLVVLAAGVGSRYGGMKQLAEVSPAGHALMDYAIYDALEAGFGRVVFVVSARTHEAVQAHIEAGCARQVKVDFARQDQGRRRKPWGTGHAVLSTRPFVDGAFGVVNADDYYGRRSFAMLGAGLSQGGSKQLLIGYTLRETLSAHGGVSRGLCLLDDDRLTSVVELHGVRRVTNGITSREHEWDSLTGDEVVSTNLWGFRPRFFDVLDEGFSSFMAEHGSDDKAEFYIGTAVNTLIQRDARAVRVVRTPDRFFGMTFPKDLADVQEQIGALIAGGHYPDPLWM